MIHSIVEFLNRRRRRRIMAALCEDWQSSGTIMKKARTNLGWVFLLELEKIGVVESMWSPVATVGARQRLYRLKDAHLKTTTQGG